MVNLDRIRKPVQKELKIFNHHFRASLKNENILLKSILEFINKRKGKQIRPLFVLLIAKLNGEINEKTYTGALLVELLHTATLIHDDIVDNSELRRNFFSLKTLWGNKIGVLLGDYLLSKGLIISLENDAYDLLKIISEAVKEMSEGELLQMKKARLLSFNENEYYEIISKKTAMLIAASGAIGAKSVGAGEATVEKMKDFGKYIGMAFQIKDDILDIQKFNSTGKSFANDIRDNKITLPLIKSYENANLKDKALIFRLLHKKNKNETDVEKIIDIITKYKGIKLAEQKIAEFKDKAYQILDEFPDSDVKTALSEFIEFNINRTK